MARPPSGGGAQGGGFSPVFNKMRQGWAQTKITSTIRSPLTDLRDTLPAQIEAHYLVLVMLPLRLTTYVWRAKRGAQPGVQTPCCARRAALRTPYFWPAPSSGARAPQAAAGLHPMLHGRPPDTAAHPAGPWVLCQRIKPCWKRRTAPSGSSPSCAGLHHPPLGTPHAMHDT